VQDWGGEALLAKEGDATVWSVFAGERDYWPAGQQWMLNYRVRDLDAMLERLRGQVPPSRSSRKGASGSC
jgi:hypothetical protein